MEESEKEKDKETAKESEKNYVSDDDGIDIYEPAMVLAKKFKLIPPLIGREVNLL